MPWRTSLNVATWSILTPSLGILKIEPGYLLFYQKPDQYRQHQRNNLKQWMM
jgi:hypothetical protein